MSRFNFTFMLIIYLSLAGCKGNLNNSDLLYYKDLKGAKKPVKSIAEWEIKRGQILDSMQAAMGKLPAMSGLPPFDIRITDSLIEGKGTYTRYRINFNVAENERVPANLYIPKQMGKTNKLPAMLALYYSDPNGKTGVEGKGQDTYWAYARELAQRGYVVIAPDYPGYGDLKDHDFNTDRYESGTMKSIFDDMRCIDLLQARTDVDPGRIGIIGHSLAGHSSMFAGAFDKRLKVIVSCSGWTLMDYYNTGEAAIKRYGYRLGPWTQDVYMPLLREKYKFDGDKFPFDFDEVIAAIAPRAFLSISPIKDSNYDVAGVRKGITSASEAYRFLGAEDKLQIRYPDAVHDFPLESRLEAYGYIDKILGHSPNLTEIK